MLPVYLGARVANTVVYQLLLINSMLLLSIQPKLSLQYKIINSANIKKLSQYGYWLSFSDIGLVFLYWPSL
jgi:hypothetical protein